MNKARKIKIIVGSALALILGVITFSFFYVPKPVCSILRDPYGIPKKICSISEMSPYQKIFIIQHEYFFPNEKCAINIETGKIECRPSSPTGCDQSATTTDCSRIVKTPLPLVAVATTSANPVQSGKIDEHLTVDNTLRDVNFCGKIYRVKQIIIDGVDVVQRIAEMMKIDRSEYDKYICPNAEGLQSNGYLILKEIGVPEVVKDTNQVHNAYRLNLIDSYSKPEENASHIGDFEIDVSTGDIFIVLQAFDGSTSEPLGKLK